ncbi:hypothetical protein F4776DRAFT_189852 [Hypoxylon sp. NC0597]|nr:hypothetical protein F4776DRAFT_189852 [Hypoxylon sp. NC0597]
MLTPRAFFRASLLSCLSSLVPLFSRASLFAINHFTETTIMADSFIILGAAAASFQFAGYAIKGLFKTIELVQDIRGARQRLSQLLSHIDREVEQINNLLHPDSPVFVQLSITQYTRISKPAIEARKLLLDIQQDLRPLVDISEDQSKPDRRWKAIVRVWKSLKNEKDLETKMTSLDRLNTSLQRELQISGFETQSLLRDQSSQILASVVTSTTEIQEMRQLIESRTALTDALGHDIIEFRESLNQGLASTSQDIVQIKDKLSNLHQDIGGITMLLSTQFQTQLSDHRSEVRTLIQDNRSELKAELTGLTMQYINEYVGNLNNRNSTFEINLRHEAARVEASSHAVQSSAGLEDYMELYGSSKSLRCRCRAGNSTSRWTCGRLAFRYETRAVKSCPVHGKKQAYRYSIEANLNPFLRGTLELTLGLLTGIKGWQIAPPLRFKSTVKRSESLLFQAIDQFVEDFVNSLSLPKTHATGPSDTILQVKRGGDQLILKWDKEFVEAGILRLARRIEEVIKSGQASGSDIDENGSNLLTDISYLVILLQDKADDVASELGQLLEMTRILEVDPMATYQMEIKKYTPRSAGLRYLVYGYLWPPILEDTHLTAIQNLMLYLITDDSAKTSFFRTARNYDGLFDSLCSFEQPHFLNLPHFQDIFLACPEVAEGCGYSELCMAVIRRCLADLKRLYRISQLEKDPERGRWDQLSPAALAVGWPEGLRFLVDQGCEIAQAFELACVKKDEESASILLSTNRAIFSHDYTERYRNIWEMCVATSHPHLPDIYTRRQQPLWIFCAASLYTPIFRVVTEELRKRQEDIKKLARQYLNQDERDRVSLSESWALDANGQEIYHLLEQRTNVPNKLDCFGGSPHCYPAARVHSIEHRNILYDAGFTDLDVADEAHEENPPDRTVRLREWNDRVLWLLEKGAQPKFRFRKDGDQNWLHLLFYLCLAMPASEVDKRIADSCSYGFVTDQCKCFCSPGGCIPPFMFWRCDDRYHIYCRIRLAHRTENLQRWTNTLNLSRRLKEYCYRAVCQLELFERLGMVHTCCKSEYRYGWRRDVTEIKEIRSEDKPSARQLGKLLRIYKNVRMLLFDFPIEEFWTIWWEAVDHILPPLLPEEACREIGELGDDGNFFKIYDDRLMWLEIVARRREERWKSMLEAAGYGGMDFEEVINCHFTKFLVLCKALVERRDAWRRHRLVGSPMSMQLRRRRRGHNITAQASHGLRRTP